MLQTIAFCADDLLVAAVWSKAETLYGLQAKTLARSSRFSLPPLAWEDLGLERRLWWFDAALLELRIVLR